MGFALYLEEEEEEEESCILADAPIDMLNTRCV